MPLFERTIAEHQLTAHQEIDTGMLNWKHLSGIVMAFHTNEWCVFMHFFSVPSGEIMVAMLLNIAFGLRACIAVHVQFTLWFMTLDVIGGVATGLGFAASIWLSVALQAWATDILGVSSLVASWLVVAAGLIGSVGTIPISHGYFERGSEDINLSMELMPNLISKTLIPFNTKLEMLHWMRIYSNKSTWRDLDTVGKEMYSLRTSKSTPDYPLHNNSCLLSISMRQC